MTIRSESQIMAAANAAQDLTNLVVAYLELYKRHAQGLNGVTVPTEPYTVVFRPMHHEGMLAVALVYTKTVTWDEPIYYDVGSDYFSESLGAENISGYQLQSESHTEETRLSIPFAVLLLSREHMEQQVLAFATSKRNEITEQRRLAKIAEHEAAIRALKTSQPSLDEVTGAGKGEGDA
jgi:hypothetical protein